MSIGSKFKDHLMELLLDPEMACKYLTEAMSNEKVNIKNKDDYFKIAILDVAKAYGITNISNKTGINRQALYKMLSNKGNPSYKNVTTILDAFGLEFTLKPKKQ
jgi:probable addiction module antidote protein